MTIISKEECFLWCERQGFGFNDEYSLSVPRVVGEIEIAYSDHRFPAQCENKLHAARSAFACFSGAEEILVWIRAWEVFPSCSHEPLFNRFRQGFGEVRSLLEAPGHLIQK